MRYLERLSAGFSIYNDTGLEPKDFFHLIQTLMYYASIMDVGAFGKETIRLDKNRYEKFCANAVQYVGKNYNRGLDIYGEDIIVDFATAYRYCYHLLSTNHE